MKIALIGAQGVGKTTLGTTLRDRITNSVLVRETVRECPYPCDQNADFKTEWWVLSHSVLAEQEAREQNPALIITDRCLLDVSVYTKLIHATGDGRISSVQREMIDGAIDSWFNENPYDFMFFLKVTPEIWQKRDLDDGFRSVDLNWYKVLTQEFNDAIDRFQISKRTRLVEVYNDGHFSETLDMVFKYLRGAKSDLAIATHAAAPSLA